MNENKSWEQLAKYFAGELSQEENLKMKSWIKEDPVREERVNKLCEIWKESEVMPYQLSVDDAWKRLSGRLDNFDRMEEKFDSVTGEKTIRKLQSHPVGKQVKKSAGMLRRVLIAAASVLIISTAALFTFYTFTDRDSAATGENMNRVFVTEEGERASYVLADDSKILLHAGSRLEIPENYNSDNREVLLRGEAYFEVAHDSEKPFIVHSQNTYTKVLGTSFLVQAWPGSDEKVEVVVSEGKVAFGDSRSAGMNSKEVLLTQNQRGILTGDGISEVSEVANMDWYLGWTEGRLVFENRPLSEVLPRLERWYDIDIQMNDEQIRENKITAEIDYSQSMSEVLQGMALTLGLEYEKAGRTITFHSQKEVGRQR